MTCMRLGGEVSGLIPLVTCCRSPFCCQRRGPEKQKEHQESRKHTNSEKGQRCALTSSHENLGVIWFGKKGRDSGAISDALVWLTGSVSGTLIFNTKPHDHFFKITKVIKNKFICSGTIESCRLALKIVGTQANSQ
jgi:hypothetical protein